jgi:hypothetical protein
MPLEMPEGDWKRLRDLYNSGLERYCQRVLEEVNQLNAGTLPSYHQRYLELYRLIERKDKQLGVLFNDNLRRSRAVELALMLRRESLMQDDEFEQFSPQTQHLIDSLLANRMP